MSLFYISFIPTLENIVALLVLFKVVPILLIILYARWQRGKKKGMTMLIGLSICLIADAVIIFSFLGGLIVFLLGHICYIIGFYQALPKTTQITHSSPPSAFGFYRAASPVPYRLFSTLLIAGYALVFGISLISYMLDDQSHMIFPVVLYMIVIGTMAAMALFTKNKYAIIGAILFVLSDSILAWHHFATPIPYSSIFIMSTYYSAQFFIAKSWIWSSK